MKNFFKNVFVLIFLTTAAHICAADASDFKPNVNVPVLNLLTAIALGNESEVTRLIVTEGVDPHDKARPDGGDTPWEATDFKAYKRMRPVIEQALQLRKLERQLSQVNDQPDAQLLTSVDL